jgi:acetyltransferase-like isoleucine patch superfamily enzyme
MISIFQKAAFRVRYCILGGFLSRFRRIYFGALGMRVGHSTYLGRLKVTWPHQIKIGRQCLFEDDIFLKFDGIWKPGTSITIGNECFIGRGVEFNIRAEFILGDHSLIGSGSKFIDHDHGIFRDELICIQEGPEKPIRIGRDVWIADNVVVLKGVSIGDGAIVGAGAIVTKSIPSFEIWAGVPAVRIGARQRKIFSPSAMIAIPQC